MKKLLVFLALLIFPLAMFAQVVEPPAGWGDVIMNPQQWFVSFGAIAVLTAFVTAFLNGVLNVTKKFVKQLLSWVVAIILLIASNLLNFGYAAEFPILLTVIHGFGAGLAANGVFDIPVIKGILDTIDGWFQKE